MKSLTYLSPTLLFCDIIFLFSCHHFDQSGQPYRKLIIHVLLLDPKIYTRVIEHVLLIISLLITIKHPSPPFHRESSVRIARVIRVLWLKIALSLAIKTWYLAVKMRRIAKAFYEGI